MKKIFVLIFLVLFSVPCFSQELYQYGVTTEIYENNTAFYKLTLIFLNNTDQTFILPIGSPENVEVESKADCNVQTGMLETVLVCAMKASEKTNIVINYHSNQKVDKKDNYFLFADSFRMSDDIKNVPIIIKLPEGTGLRKPVEGSYSPGSALIGSDGRRTIIVWELKDLKKDSRVDVSIAFEKIGEVVISEIPIEVLIFIFIVIVSAVFIFYQFYWKGNDIRLILPILKKDEKLIFDAIRKRGDGVNQKIIVNDSGYSKAKVSKVLNSLEERGVLKLERVGRKNKVHIEKKFEKS